MLGGFGHQQNIGDIITGKTAFVRVSAVRRSDGSNSVDVRRWMSTADYSGPTKKGIRIDADKVTELIDLLGQAQQAVAEYSEKQTLTRA